MKTSLLWWAGMASVCWAVGANAHDEDLKAGNVPPRIGRISNEVAIERLKAAGIVNPQIVRSDDAQIIATGSSQGQAMTLRIDTLRGVIVDQANPAKVIAGPGAPAINPVVTGPRIVTERATLSAPVLMQGAVK